MLAGSSPLARGLPDRAFICAMHARIIPARAGFTRHRGVDQRLVRDHPRSRGVYEPVDGGTDNDQGSSPLARGLRRNRSSSRAGSGIIPARAGFTLSCGGGARRLPDHPRSRGVYAWPGRRRSARRGSSPLARGLPTLFTHTRAYRGIIPARAGFTRADPFLFLLTWDHPRSRGVYAPPIPPLDVPPGSSPLARGLPRSGPTTSTCHGIIPARAGFTWCTAQNSPLHLDHPRSRGVYLGRFFTTFYPSGSSPLARGLRSGWMRVR